MEAADDICYEMMDLEDACKLHIVPFEKARDLYLGFFEGEHRKRRLEHLMRQGGRDFAFSLPLDPILQTTKKGPLPLL